MPLENRRSQEGLMPKCLIQTLNFKVILYKIRPVCVRLTLRLSPLWFSLLRFAKIEMLLQFDSLGIVLAR